MAYETISQNYKFVISTVIYSQYCCNEINKIFGGLYSILNCGLIKDFKYQKKKKMWRWKKAWYWYMESDVKTIKKIS